MAREFHAHVQGLADPCLTRQVTDNPGDEIPRCAGLIEDALIEPRELVASLFADRVVILAAQPVIPDPGDTGTASGNHA